MAVKIFGGALYSKLRVKEWENVLNSKMWDFPNDEILLALRLSYFFPSFTIKTVLFYCSIFPKDYKFEKENLILLWMVEGFLKETNDTKTMEEVADGYLCDLV